MVLQNCKLTYFGIPGRGESIRLALTIGNVTFQDERIEFKDWKDLKPSTPYGSIPTLTLSDGTVIAQQRAILRMVGKETGLYPSDVVAAAKVDEIMDAVEDIFPVVMKAGQGLEKAEKEAARKASCDKGGDVYNTLEKIDVRIGANEGAAFAVGTSLTVADLFVYCILTSMVSGLFDGIPSDTLDQFENVTALRKAVRSSPSVCKWYDCLDSSIKLPAAYGKL